MCDLMTRRRDPDCLELPEIRRCHLGPTSGSRGDAEEYIGKAALVPQRPRRTWLPSCSSTPLPTASTTTWTKRPPPACASSAPRPVRRRMTSSWFSSSASCPRGAPISARAGPPTTSASIGPAGRPPPPRGRRARPRLRGTHSRLRTDDHPVDLHRRALLASSGTTATAGVVDHADHDARSVGRGPVGASLRTSAGQACEKPRHLAGAHCRRGALLGG